MHKNIVMQYALQRLKLRIRVFMLKSARNAPDGAFRIRRIMLILGNLKLT